MKKFLFAAMTAMFAMGYTACNNEEVENAAVNDNGNRTIDFDILQNSRMATRGAVTDLTSMETENNTFEVWGFFSTDATGEGVTPSALYLGSGYTSGVTVTYNGSSWNYSPKKFWPDITAKLNFQAVSPTNYGMTINSPADGISALGKTLTIPAANADQKDLVFGSAESVNYATSAQMAQLKFRHALSQIVFQALVNSDDLVAEVGGVTVANVIDRGNVGFLGTVDGQFRNLDVKNLTTTASKKFPAGLTSTNVTVTAVQGAGDAVALTAADGALMMMPSVNKAGNDASNDAWKTTAAAPVSIADADAAMNSYIDVTCKVRYTDGTYLLGSATEYGHVYIPFKASWEIGKKYVYNLVFGTGSGGYDEEGNPVMNFINFEIDSVEDWTEVAAQSINF